MWCLKCCFLPLNLLICGFCVFERRLKWTVLQVTDHYFTNSYLRYACCPQLHNCMALQVHTWTWSNWFHVSGKNSRTEDRSLRNPTGITSYNNPVSYSYWCPLSKYYMLYHLSMISMHSTVKLAMITIQHLVRLLKSASQIIAPLCSGMGHEYLKNYKYSKSFPDYLYV